jgi:hypothetical protein
MAPGSDIDAIANDLNECARAMVEPDDVMLSRQPLGDRATDQSSRASDQYPHVPPRLP